MSHPNTVAAGFAGGCSGGLLRQEAFEVILLALELVARAFVGRVLDPRARRWRHAVHFLDAFRQQKLGQVAEAALDQAQTRRIALS